MVGEIRYAVRQLRRSPGFTGVAVAALAIGIGGTSAMFSVVNTVLLRPLPFRQPGRLVAVYEGIPTAGLPSIPFSTPDYVAFARETQTFAAVGGFQNADFELSGGDMPRRVTGARVTASLFRTLGLEPAVGRAFTEAEDRQFAPVALISHALWEESFAGAPIGGIKLLLDRRPYQVIGVLPANIELPSRGPQYNSEPADVIVPMSYTPAELAAYGSRFATSVIGRLRPGATMAQAREEGKRLAGNLLNFYPAALRGRGLSLAISVRPLEEDIAGQSRTLLLVLLGAVTLVLLIACADVANLMLTRAAGRRREFALRAALGAGRGGIVRAVMAESAVLAAFGAAAGVVLAHYILRLLAHAAVLDVPRMETARIDGAALGFTAGVAVFSTLFFGVAPALAALRTPAGEALKESARGSASRGQRRLLGGLAASQFALAMVLLAGAGLLLRSFEQLRATDPGFRPEHVLAVSLSLPNTTYSRAADIRSFYARLQDAAAVLPGVKSAGESNALPLHMAREVTFSVENAAASPAGVAPTASAEYISGEYFQTLGVMLRSGRFFSAGDGAESTPVAIVNETLARQFFPEGAVGRRIKFGIRGNFPWLTIVGVVADIRQGPLNTEASAGIYEPLAQVGDPTVADPLAGGVRARHLLVRAAGDPAQMAPAVRAAVRRLDPDLAIGKVETLADVLRESSAAPRFDAVLVVCFAGVALLLAGLGTAGVLSYTTAQRTREIGIRVALGAGRGEILRMVVGSGLRLAGIGIAAGLVGAMATTRVIGKLLYRVGPRDPWTFGGAVAVLVAAALGAAFVAGRRAVRVDPIAALRE